MQRDNPASGAEVNPREIQAGRFAAIVLAAGQSRRFGDSNKLTALLEGKALLEHVLGLVCGLGLADVVVVTGAPNRNIDKILHASPVRTISNINYLDGMGTSIAAGARAIGECDGVFIILGDMPYLSRQDYHDLMGSFSGRQDICRPVFQEHPGHPVLFGAAYIDELVDLTGDAGAKAILKTHIHQIKFVEVGTSAIVKDIDRPSDLGV